MSEKETAGWQNIRRQINGWSNSALVTLVKDLYGASTENRDFLQARFQAEQSGGAALEKYRRRIVAQFFPARGFGMPKLAEARKAIRDYRKATGNLENTVDLLLTYVENGTDFTVQFGDINASYYSSLNSALNEMVHLLWRECPKSYPRFRERIQKLETNADRIGWGYGDNLRDQVFYLESELGPREPQSDDDLPTN